MDSGYFRQQLVMGMDERIRPDRNAIRRSSGGVIRPSGGGAEQEATC